MYLWQQLHVILQLTSKHSFILLFHYVDQLIKLYSLSTSLDQRSKLQNHLSLKKKKTILRFEFKQDILYFRLKFGL